MDIWYRSQSNVRLLRVFYAWEIRTLDILNHMKHSSTMRYKGALTIRCQTNIRWKYTRQTTFEFTNRIQPDWYTNWDLEFRERKTTHFIFNELFNLICISVWFLLLFCRFNFANLIFFSKLELYWDSKNIMQSGHNFEIFFFLFLVSLNGHCSFVRLLSPKYSRVIVSKSIGSGYYEIFSHGSSQGPLDYQYQGSSYK